VHPAQISARLPTSFVVFVLLNVGCLANDGLPMAKEAATTPRSRGFVLANFTLAAHEGDTKLDCPDGLTLSPIDSFIALLPIEQQARIERPGDLSGQVRMMLGVKDPKALEDRANYRRLISHTNCTNPEEFPEYTGHRTVQHRGPAIGLNLDGRENSKSKTPAPGTCAHDDFTGPSGERGIDNQLWRVLGCVKGTRSDGDILRQDNAHIRQGGPNVLLEITDIDDERNDPEVTVGIYQDADSVRLNASGDVLPGASLQVDPNPKYHAKLKARIENGIVLTEVGTVTLKREGIGRAPPIDLTLTSARLKLELLPNGNTKGILGGYYDIDEFYRAAIGVHTLAGSQVMGYTCPGVLDQMRKLADGDLDPTSGACRSISMAWQLDGVPAFVIHGPANAADSMNRSTVITLRNSGANSAR